MSRVGGRVGEGEGKAMDDITLGAAHDNGDDDRADEKVSEKALGPDKLREKMLFILTVWPSISPSMLQVAMGAYCPPRDWRPILESLIDSGIISQEKLMLENYLGQHRSYTRLSLSEGYKRSAAVIPA